MNNRPLYILPIIVAAQFAGTSLWFAGNAVVKPMQAALNLVGAEIGMITSAVQLGFISGTFLFALLTITDRFLPSKVFLFSSLGAAAFNALIPLLGPDLTGLLLLRFGTGFFLAGIYPVGMKIAADWYEKGLGKALGFLVGALVVGTAFPHLLNEFAGTISWEWTLFSTSILASAGGILIYLLVPAGPFRKPSPPFEWNALRKIFSFPDFRAAAFGYFGHMWELYTFWAFLPLLLQWYKEAQGLSFSVPMWSFISIAVGGLGCIIGGYWSQRKGSVQVAMVMLLISGFGCLGSPILGGITPIFFFGYILIWGFTVVGDSPQFSTLVAQTAPKAYIGTALTIVNSIGFALTIVSLQVFSTVSTYIPEQFWFWLLLPGPIFGLVSIRSLWKKSNQMS